MSAPAEMRQLKEAGFSDAEMGAWAAQRYKELSDAGFGQGEIDTYFGHPPFNDAPVKSHVTETLKQATAPTTEGGQPKPITSFLDALKAGFGESVTGLMTQGKPTTTVSPDAPRSSRIAAQVGTLAGDVPAMVVGAVAGGANPITGMAGAFALPQGMRKILMDKYEKGEVQGFPDFWDRFSGAFIDTAKGWITGAATGAAGKAIGMAPIVSPTAKAAATVTGEIATMVTVGKALEGQVPNADDFIDTALALGFVKGTVKAAGKLRKIYAETGVKPDEVAQDVQRDPTILKDLAAENVDIPSAYRPELTKAAGAKPVEAELTAPQPEESIPVDEARTKILDRIVQKDHAREKMSLSAIYTSIFDNLNPIYKAMETADATKLPTSKNPYELERLTRGTMGKGTEFIKHGAFRFDTYETVTRGYEQILEPVKKDLDGFRAYMVAKRAIEKAGQGIETGIPLEEAKTIAREGKGKYEAVFQERLQYRTALLDYLEQSGILSAEKKQAMQAANKDYVPFYRFFEDPTTGGPGSSRSVRQPIKEMKGSERKILDPIVSDIKDTFLFVGLAEKNAARRAFVELGEPVATLIQGKTDGVTKQAIKDLVKEHGISEDAAKAVASIKPSSFRSQADELVVFVDGKRQVYKVDPKVAEAFQDLDKISSNFLTEMFVHTPANLLRAGVVTTPEYITRNIMRDAISAFIYAGSNPVKTAKGLKSIITQDTAFHNWLKGGGGNATMVALDRDYIHNHIVDLNLETGMLQRAWNVAKTPIDILRATSELIENSTRVGTVRDELAQTKDKARIQALSMIAREATVDFARHGKDTQEFGKMTAFFNPTLQGIDRFTREMQANPLGTTAKAMASVTLPTLLLWYANKDDEEIQNLPRWQKMAFWMTRVPLPDGGSFILRIPMPQEFGILFGAVPERLLDRFVKDNPDALRDIDKAMLQAFTPSFTPTLAVPIISQFANRDTFRGQPIIPMNMEGLLPEYQYMPYTTELAKAMGQIVGAFPGIRDAAVSNKDPFIGGTARALNTPVLIETYLRDWTGGMGMYLFQLADKALRQAGALPDPVQPASTLADLPIIKAFVARYPSSSAQSVQDFYDDYEASKKYFDTIMHLAKQGDARAIQLAQDHQADLAQLTDLRSALTMQSQIIRMVHKNPDLSADDKRQIIDTLYYRMIELSQAGNQSLRMMKDAFTKQ